MIARAFVYDMLAPVRGIQHVARAVARIAAARTPRLYLAVHSWLRPAHTFEYALPGQRITLRATGYGLSRRYAVTATYTDGSTAVLA
jgi:hypothetical protein